MNKPPSARILATIYACSERSIRNYRAEGAPLHDPAAMFGWWSARKNLPRGAAAKGLAAIQEAFVAVTGTAAASGSKGAAVDVAASTLGSLHLPEDDHRAGAEHELRWLESLAVEARRNLVQAHRGGNAVTQKQALDAYLKITEGLRKFDNQVSADRRDSGEMVTRAQVEEPITALTVWLRRGIESLVNGFCLQVAECDSPQQVYTIAAEGLRQSLSHAVNAACADGKFPPWMRQAFERGL